MAAGVPPQRYTPHSAMAREGAQAASTPTSTASVAHLHSRYGVRPPGLDGLSFYRRPVILSSKRILNSCRH
eukprot:scaffold127198_cov28-Tisochrysis_lutea.AAC.1